MNESSFNRVIRRHTIAIEFVTGMAAVGFLVYSLRSMLVSGETMPMHDNVIWGYPTFQFFAESIINCHYPFWNPFSHSGEPFYPIILQRLFLDPVVLIVIYIGKFIADDIVMLFNWHHFIRCMVMVFGMYIVFRPLARHPFIRLTLIPILLYSSFILVSFRQNSFVELFVWLPYITFFFLRIIYYKNYGWHNWLAFAGLVGLNWQSYYFTGYWVFLFFILLGIVFFRRDLLGELFRSNGVIPKLAVASAIILLMMAPNIALMQEKGKYTFPARMMNVSSLDGSPMYAPLGYEGKPGDIVKGTLMPYKVISHTGTPSSIWDFIQIISPDGNRFLAWPDRQFWGHPSEAFIYIGILPWAIALLGMVAGVHDLKKVWLLILVGFGLLLLGPAGGLHRLLYYIYPPLWFIRHTSLFVLYFIFTLLYFYVLGFNHIFATWGGRLFSRNIKGGILDRLSMSGSIVLLVFPIAIIGIVCFMALLRYPETNFLSCYIILIIAIYWLFRNDLGSKGLYTSLIVSHIVVVLNFNQNLFSFISYIVIASGIPLAVFLFIRMHAARAVKNNAVVIMIVVFTVFLCGDLIYSFKLSSVLYNTQKHPKLAYGITTTLHKPPLPQNRLIFLPRHYAIGSYDLRYPSLLYHRSSVFSPVYPFDEITGVLSNVRDETFETFEEVLMHKRSNSFLLLKNYFNLINSGIPPMAMKEMFAVGEPMFQFKNGAVLADDWESYDCLKQMGSERSVQFLQDYVFIDRYFDKSLKGTGIPVEDYAQIDQAALAVENYKEGEGNGQDDKYLYDIKRYAYNSFDMEVSTDEVGILYWSDGYDKWWRAYINGTEVPVCRANINFKAVVLPKGENNVMFVYSPVFFITSVYVFYGVFIVSIAVAGLMRIIGMLSLQNKPLLRKANYLCY